MMRTNAEDALRSRIAQKPKNARATASLACLLVEQTRLSDNDGYSNEAVELALRSIQLQPKKPFGYAALSVADPNFDERMKALQTAISLSSEDHFMARVGLLSRLLFEPRQEQARNLPGKIAKASKRHPGRKDLNAAETTVYETLEKGLIHAYNKQPTEEMDPSGSMEVLALLDYKLGLFFRKRLPVTLHQPRARHHLKRAYSNLPLDHPKKNVTQFWLATLDETTEMTRCPPEYIVSLYSTFSNQFDDLLVGKLAYKTPTVLRQLLNDSVTQ